jgi:hypothetical protein
MWELSMIVAVIALTTHIEEALAVVVQYMVITCRTV